MNAIVDDDGENRHTGGVGYLFSQASIGPETGTIGFTADRSACSLVHEKRKGSGGNVNSLGCGLVMYSRHSHPIIVGLQKNL